MKSKKMCIGAVGNLTRNLEPFIADKSQLEKGHKIVAHLHKFKGTKFFNQGIQVYNYTNVRISPIITEASYIDCTI
jgi:hypothetical protein